MRAAQTLRSIFGPLRLIHADAGPELLRLTRKGIMALWIFKLLLDPLWRLAELPHGLFQPLGLLTLFPSPWLDQWMTGTGLLIFWMLTLLILGACLFDRCFLVASVAAAIMLTIYSSLIRGFGPPVHTDIVLLLAVYALSLFSWADEFKAGRHAGEGQPGGRPWSSVPLVTIVALLCLSYCLVGLNRALAGGVRVFMGDTMEVWAVDASLRGYYFNTDIGWRVPQWPFVVWMLQGGLPVITLFEITAPLCLICARYRWLFIPVMFSFHLLSLVVMNIFFFDDMLLYLLLVDWSQKFRSLSKTAVLEDHFSGELEASAAGPDP